MPKSLLRQSMISRKQRCLKDGNEKGVSLLLRPYKKIPMKNYVVVLCMMLWAALTFGQQKEKTDSAAKDSVAVVAKVDSVAKVADTVSVKKDTLPKSYYSPVNTSPAPAALVVPVVAASAAPSTAKG